MTAASIRSVLANCPIARAKSRTCRGLTTTTGNCATTSAAPNGRSSPPVASKTINCGCCASTHRTRAAIPGSVLSQLNVVPVGRQKQSRRSLETSTPMNVLEIDISFLRQHGPALLIRALAQATVRALARNGAAITAGVRSFFGPGLLNDLPRRGSGLKVATKAYLKPSKPSYKALCCRPHPRAETVNTHFAQNCG